MGEKANTHVFLCWNPSDGTWRNPELLQGPPMRIVRRLLGGDWTRSSGSLADDLAAAFWNARSGRKLLVMRVEACVRILSEDA
jgi:hypothetical protein